MRGAVGDGALQRVELAQRRDQFLALRGGSANAIGDWPSRRAVTRKVGTPRCAARSQIGANIAPFL